MNTRQCPVCNKIFYPSNQQVNRGQGIVCSMACRSGYIKGPKHQRWRGGLATVVCIGCGTQFKKEPSRVKHGRGKFCSRACKGKWMSANIVGETSYRWRGKTITLECAQCGAKFRRGKAHIIDNNRSFCSNKCRLLWQVKENNPNWKGGISTENQLIRESVRGRDWREAIYKRDGYTCQECGKVGSVLNAHHIKPFAKYPEHRFDINNGITLCKQCHKIKHAKKH